MPKTFNFKSTDKLYYQQAITVLREIPPYSKLRTQEILVLSRLMYFYNELVAKGVDVKTANIALFDSTYKNQIIEEMANSDDPEAFKKAFATFSNILTSLRKKGFILREDGKNVLNPKRILNSKEMNPIIFQFKINA